MRVGINRPWYSKDSYGWDFGPFPVARTPSSSQPGQHPVKDWQKPSANPLYKTVLDADLALLKSYGIECVRWFVFADGINLEPPILDKNTGIWSVPSSNLKRLRHQNDFAKLLEVFARQKMGLIPCLIDNRIFWDPVILLAHPEGQSWEVRIDQGTLSVNEFVNNYYKSNKNILRDDARSPDWSKFIKGGRRPALENSTTVQAFLSDILQPLLDVANSKAEYAEQIIAWDLINEPEQAFQKSDKQNASPINGFNLAKFLQFGLNMIWKANFKATVGFQTAMAFGHDDGYQTNHSNTDGMKDSVKFITDQMTRGGWVGRSNFIVQVHFYGGEGYSEQSKLLPASAFKAGPSSVMMGEFATAIPAIPRVTPWALGHNDTVGARLEVLKSAGYDYALPWSALDGSDEFSTCDLATFESIGSAALGFSI